MKTKIAKIIRVATVPPIIVTILILILMLTRPDIFRSPLEAVFSIFCLGIVPALAYPLQPFIPALKNNKREGQRTLAFILTAIGYTIAVITGYILHVTASLQFLYNGYFVSVIMLVIFNKLLHIRASGHATSITGPLIFLIFFVGSYAVIPCIIMGVLVAWSSLFLKRHKASDLAFGALVCLIAFSIMYPVYTAAL